MVEKNVNMRTTKLEEECRVATFLGLGAIIFEDSLELSLDDSHFSNPVYCKGTFYGMMNE